MKLAYNINIDDNSLEDVFVPNDLSTNLIVATIDDIIKNVDACEYFPTLDYGCGCGYIGLALAKQMNNICKVTLYDNDEKAIKSAETNMYYNNLNQIDILDNINNIDTKFTNIIFYQPWLSLVQWKSKKTDGQKLEPKNAYVINRNTYKNFISFCSKHISDKHYLILLQYVDDDTYNKLSQMFKDAIPNCIVEARKYAIYKFIAITDEKSQR